MYELKFYLIFFKIGHFIQQRRLLGISRICKSRCHIAVTIQSRNSTFHSPGQQVPLSKFTSRVGTQTSSLSYKNQVCWKILCSPCKSSKVEICSTVKVKTSVFLYPLLRIVLCFLCWTLDLVIISMIYYFPSRDMKQTCLFVTQNFIGQIIYYWTHNWI